MDKYQQFPTTAAAPADRSSYQYLHQQESPINTVMRALTEPNIPTVEHLCDELGNVAEMAAVARCAAVTIADRIGGPAEPQVTSATRIADTPGCLVDRLETLIAQLRASLNATHDAHRRAGVYLG